MPQYSNDVVYKNLVTFVEQTFQAKNAFESFRTCWQQESVCQRCTQFTIVVTRSVTASTACKPNAGCDGRGNGSVTMQTFDYGVKAKTRCKGIARPFYPLHADCVVNCV